MGQYQPQQQHVLEGHDQGGEDSGREPEHFLQEPTGVFIPEPVPR